MEFNSIDKKPTGKEKYLLLKVSIYDSMQKKWNLTYELAWYDKADDRFYFHECGIHEYSNHSDDSNKYKIIGWHELPKI